MSSFPGKAIDAESLALFRRVALGVYRNNLRKSFIAHLRCQCPLEWSAYLEGGHDTHKGGIQSEFKKSWKLEYMFYGEPINSHGLSAMEGRRDGITLEWKPEIAFKCGPHCNVKL